MDYKLFQDNILHHYRNPQNKGPLERATFSAHDNNPLCGDDITIQVRMKEGRVERANFSGSGCAISQATASMLTEDLKGKSERELEGLDKDYVVRLVGIPLSPVRLKCALLPLRVLKVGLYEHEGKAEEAQRARRQIG